MEGKRDLQEVYAEAHSKFWQQYEERSNQTRVVSIGEHMLRIFGYKRNEPLYGIEGDHIAEKFPESGPHWTGMQCNDDYLPAFVAESRRNETLAYVILIGGALGISLFALQCYKHVRDSSVIPQEQFSYIAPHPKTAPVTDPLVSAEARETAASRVRTIIDR